MNRDGFQSLIPHLENILPSHVVQDGPLFVDFLEAYFEWLEQPGNSGELYNVLGDIQSIDKSIDRFYDDFRYEYMNTLPPEITADKALVAKHIQSLYQAKGTERGVKLLFRILYGEEVTIDYPGERILKPSSARWVQQNYVLASNILVPDTYLDSTLAAIGRDPDSEINLITPKNLQTLDIVGQALYGPDTGTTGVVENIIVDDDSIYRVFVSEINGSFADGETVQVLNTDYALKISSGPAGQTLFETDGYFATSAGFLDDVNVLQNGARFQEYSYVINSSRSIVEYEKIFRRNVHPGGIYLGGDISMQSTTRIVTENESEFRSRIDARDMYMFIAGVSEGDIGLDNVIGYRRIDSSAVRRVMPRVDWQAGRAFEIGDTVLTSDNNVYRCTGTLRLAVTDEPKIVDGTDSEFETVDGYRWAYLFTVSSYDLLKYMTRDYIPVPKPKESVIGETGVLAVSVAFRGGENGDLPVGARYYNYGIVEKLKKTDGTDAQADVISAVTKVAVNITKGRFVIGETITYGPATATIVDIDRESNTLFVVGGSLPSVDAVIEGTKTGSIAKVQDVIPPTATTSAVVIHQKQFDQPIPRSEKQSENFLTILRF